MISISDLLIDDRIPSNYFSSKTYVKGDLELGLLENRRGDRLLAVPSTLIAGIYAGLKEETGQASGMVLFNCGLWWGKNFYARFCEELTEYYKVAVADMAMIDFLQNLKQCWVTHGWGRIELDQSYNQQGFIIVKTWNSPFAELAEGATAPSCYLECGILTSFFCNLTGRELGCVQTTCESMGADKNQFVIGLIKRMKPIEDLVTQGMAHEQIMAQLPS